MSDDVPEMVAKVADAIAEAQHQWSIGPDTGMPFISLARAAIAAMREAGDDPAQEVAYEAYQVIGMLASAGGLFDHPETIRALDYFGYDQWRDPEREILPFGEGLPDPDAALTAPPPPSDQGS